MTNRIFQILLFSCITLMLFNSCKKENIDTSEITPDVVIPDTIICNLSIDIFATNLIDSSFLSVNVTDATGDLNYLWSEGSTGTEIFPMQDTTYSVTVTDELGCTAEGQFDYIAIIDPCTLFSVEIMVVDSISPPFLFTNIFAGSAPFTYLWSEGSVSSTIEITLSGTYFVTVTDNEGCTATDDITF